MVCSVGSKLRSLNKEANVRCTNSPAGRIRSRRPPSPGAERYCCGVRGIRRRGLPGSPSAFAMGGRPLRAKGATMRGPGLEGPLGLGTSAPIGLEFNHPVGSAGLSEERRGSEWAGDENSAPGNGNGEGRPTSDAVGDAGAQGSGLASPIHARGCGEFIMQL
eukprot:2230986-Pyramimonas_sp.AAC.1